MTCSIEQFRYIGILHLQWGRLLMDSLIHFRNENILYLPGGRCGKSHVRHVILDLQTVFPIWKMYWHMACRHIFMAISSSPRKKNFPWIINSAGISANRYLAELRTHGIVYIALCITQFLNSEQTDCKETHAARAAYKVAYCKLIVSNVTNKVYTHIFKRMFIIV